jgi:hypothetical protein
MLQRTPKNFEDFHPIEFSDGTGDSGQQVAKMDLQNIS